MADNYVITVEVDVDGDAYDDPMDALAHVDELLTQSDAVTHVDATMQEDPS